MQKDFEIKLKNNKGISSLGTELNANELKNINGGDDFLHDVGWVIGRFFKAIVDGNQPKGYSIIKL
jgi:hypothetical protein